MKIDLHAHYLPGDCLNITDSKGRMYGHTTMKDESGKEVLVSGPGLGGISIAELCDPEKRLRDMDGIGLDMQAVSISPPNVDYSLDPEEGLRHSLKYNNGIAELVRAYPERFAGMATLPMQDMTGAVDELDRAVHELGFKAVEILSNVNGKNLDERELWPFYQKAQDLDVLIYVHPRATPAPGNMKKYWLANLVGNPFNTALAIASIIFGGVLESFPRLRFLFSHAGGAAPYTRGRWERGYHNWEACHSIPRPPSEYFKLLYFDNIALFDPALAFLVDTVGADKVVLGSDYPGMWHPDPIATVRNAAGISAIDKEKILEKTAAALLKLAI